MTIFFKCPICHDETCSFSDHKEHTSKCLKPCPFCGGEPSQSEGWQNTNPTTIKYYIECIDCGAMAGWEENRSDAAEAWNKREPCLNADCGYVPYD